MPPPSSAKLPVGGLKATPLTGVTKTPLRGPLVERAIALREMCIKVLGMPLFLRAIEVRSESGPDGGIALRPVGCVFPTRKRPNSKRADPSLTL